ncbi:hypothetical protein [Bartonella sp. HY761]|uniref:hypothetical protein n=1 Tax=Bartonella sp. HY761 TaxID=2979330 RepID=UPI00220242A0|nr:hypothetical protein [Bartonella sp. HY761]UXN07201.1 hypothetical protein N6A79_04120 [Bartonella sp. HY761]
MRRLFWPLLTTIIFFSVMALWFCLGAMTTQLTNEVENLLTDKIWATYDLDGRDLTIRGIAATENIESDVLAKAAAIWGIASVTDEVIVPPLKAPFEFILEKNDDTITIKGDFPVEFDRFAILDNMDGVVVDQAGNARGADEKFAEWLHYAAAQIQQLKSGEIILSDDVITINGIAKNGDAEKAIKDLSIPNGLKLQSLTLKSE